MEKIITYENLRNFAYSSDKLIEGEIKGIVISFYGLGGASMYSKDPGTAIDLAKKGIVYVHPYTNPWCWMNESAVKLTDEIVDVLCDKYGLGDGVKIVSSGGSMGGLSALVYTAYARITPVACVVNCPVCDLPYHYTERDDLPRTLYSAFFTYEGSMDEALRSASPLHLTDKMPDVPYVIYHCTADAAVNIDKHSVAFVEAMKGADKNIELIKVDGRGHCDLSAEAALEYFNSLCAPLA